MEQKKKRILPQYKIKNMPLKNLKDNPRNPRTIEDTALKGLVASIEEFGLIEPIIWNKRTGYIVGGHQRRKALESAGYKEAQVLVVDFPEEKEMMANISLNNPKIQGEFNDTLGDILRKQADAFPDLSRELMLTDLSADHLIPSEEKKEKPEVQFTEELYEEHNYLVLTFKNKADWLFAQTLYPLETVKALDSKPGFEKQGVGRVVDGVRFLEKVRGQS